MSVQIIEVPARTYHDLVTSRVQQELQLVVPLERFINLILCSDVLRANDVITNDKIVVTTCDFRADTSDLNRRFLRIRTAVHSNLRFIPLYLLHVRDEGWVEVFYGVAFQQFITDLIQKSLSERELIVSNQNTDVRVPANTPQRVVHRAECRFQMTTGSEDEFAVTLTRHEVRHLPMKATV